MTKIIIANWKANPLTLAEAQELFRAEVTEAEKYKNVQTVICPPFVYLEELAKQLQGSSLHSKDDPCSLGVQDVFWKESEIIEPQKLGISHVLVGHSDKRYLPTGGGETDETINKKIKIALGAGITPVLLVGERNKGDDKRQVLEKQLSADLAGLNSDQISKVLIAYEPVWAISTSPGAESDTPENTLKAIHLINEILSITYNLEPRTCLYGGSITQDNITDFLSHPEISGAVIGAASLRKEEFAKILELTSEL